MITRKRAFRGVLTLTVALGFAAAALPGLAAVERTPTVERTPAAEAASARVTAPVPLPLPVPSNAVASDARLRALLHRLTAVDGAPGAFVETRDRRGSAVLTDGVADVERLTPLDPDSRFRIGSMTKTFTATAMLQLVGSGASTWTRRWSATCPGSSAVTATTGGGSPSANCSSTPADCPISWTTSTLGTSSWTRWPIAILSTW